MKNKGEPCQYCDGTYLPGKVSEVFDYDDSLLVVRAIPALVCGRCNDYCIDIKVADKLDKIVDEFKKEIKSEKIIIFDDVA